MVADDIAFYSFHRAERSIRRADVVLLLIDGTQPVSEPDKKLAEYIASQFKPVIIVVNKWDLARQRIRENREDAKNHGVDDTQIMEEFRKYLDAELRHINYAPIAFITAKESRNVQSVLDLSQHLFNQASERVSTSKLNQAIRQILEERRPPTPTGRRARVYYVTQTDVAPPTIVLFVNKPELIDEMYQRYMINRMRELLPYAEVPIKLVIRERSSQPREVRMAQDAEEQQLTPDVDSRPRPAPIRHVNKKKPIRTKTQRVLSKNKKLARGPKASSKASKASRRR
jgi:GTP-binding protein